MKYYQSGREPGVVSFKTVKQTKMIRLNIFVLNTFAFCINRSLCVFRLTFNLAFCFYLVQTSNKEHNYLIKSISDVELL